MDQSPILWYNSTMIPNYIRVFLWSYDINKLDMESDKKRIITNVLNLGTKKATDWIFENYSKNDITKTVQKPLKGEWSNKSLNYWSVILDVPTKVEHQT